MKVNSKKIVLDGESLKDSRASTLDVSINGHRVWSTPKPRAKAGPVVIRWPIAIRERLEGTGTVEVSDSSTGAVLASTDTSFGRSGKPLELTDSLGRWLALDKWDRLGPVLEGRDDGVVQRLLTGATKLVETLDELGLPTYIVGGTLLGVVREGGMMAHDDDVDLAYLSEYSDPADIGIESYKVGRALEAAGFTIVRHSFTHIEIVFFTPEGDLDFYIDVFTGFFRDGLYCQPFALRGPEVKKSDLVPTRPMDVNGFVLPAPAKPEAWLAFAYGKNWRVPDPSFQFITPLSTLRRFEHWFGVYNRGRVFWEKHFLADGEPVGTQGGDKVVRDFLNVLPPHSHVVDLGCGDGRWTEQVAAAGHTVIGIDYSFEALRIARAAGQHGVTYELVNMNDRAALLEFGYRLLQTGKTWYVFSNATLQGMTGDNRQAVQFFLRQVLRGDGFAYFVNDTRRSSSYRRALPETWGFPLRNVRRSYARFRLNLEVVRRGHRWYGRELRPTATFIIKPYKIRAPMRP